MADRIEIDFTANVGAVTRGTDEIADGFEDVEDALGDAGDAGEDAGEQISEGLSEAEDAAGDTSDALGNVGDALGDVGSVAKDALEGDLASAAEGGLDAVSGLAAAIPGVGALIGVAFSEVGKGIISSFQESSEESKERVNSMYDDMAKSGLDYLSEQFLQQQAQEVIKTNYDRIREVAELTGLTEAQVVRGMVTAGEERNSILDLANEKYQEQLELVSTASGYTDAEASNAATLAAQYAKVVDEFANLNGEQSVAIGQTQLFREATNTALSEAQLGVEDLKTATESFQPIPISVDLSQADAQVNEFVGRARRLIIRADVSSEGVH